MKVSKSDKRKSSDRRCRIEEVDFELDVRADVCLLKLRKVARRNYGDSEFER